VSEWVAGTRVSVGVASTFIRKGGSLSPFWAVFDSQFPEAVSGGRERVVDS
jgi:hypothetical protein